MPQASKRKTNHSRLEEKLQASGTKHQIIRLAGVPRANKRGFLFAEVCEMSLQAKLLSVSCVVLAMLGVLGTQGQGGIIAQWNLDENPITVGTTLAADQTGNWNLTYKTTAAPVTGPFGDGAVNFYQNGYAKNSSLFSSSSSPTANRSALTVECYFKLDAAVPTGWGNELRLYVEGSSANERLSLQIGANYKDGGGNYIKFNQQRSSWGTDLVANDPNGLSIGTWYYAAATFDGTTQTVYLFDTTSSTLYSDSGSGPTGTATYGYAVIGNGLGGTNSRYFPGAIDNVTVYDSVLSSDVIMQHGQMLVPEPSTLAILAAGLIGLLCYAWRKRRQ
jgi:hypothetical protein